VSAVCWIVTLLGLGAVPQEPVAQDNEASHETPAPPAFDQELGLEEILTGLGRLVDEYPELASIETLGHSPLGHELQVVTLTDPSTGSPEEKPGLFFVDHRAPGDTRGAEAVLAFGWSLASRAGHEPGIEALLADHVVYLMPACDPDARVVEDRTARAPIEFDLNFPLGWLPDSLRPGSGAFPLARPETEALAGFLAAHTNLVLIVSVAPPGPAADGPWRGAEFPEADREALDALSASFSGRADLELRPWGRLGSPGGGLFDHAYQALGIYPVAWVGAEADAASVKAIAKGTLGLLRRMPRMRIDPAAMREVAPGLWEVDVAISNGGVLPTLSALAAKRRTSGELYLDVEGTKLVATARKHDADAPFRTARLHPGSEAIDLLGSTLRGGETRWLRLILEGEAGTVVELQGVGVRAGSLRLELELQSE